MKKTVIKFREQEYLNAVQHFSKLQYLGRNLRDAYPKFVEDTEMPEFNLSDFKSLLIEGKRHLEGRINFYVSEQKKPLQKHFLEACYKALHDHLGPIFLDLEAWRRNCHSLNIPHEFSRLHNLEINEELEIVINHEFKDKLKTVYEIYITSDVDHQLHEKYLALGNAYNDLMEFAKANDVKVPSSFNSLFRVHPINQDRFDSVQMFPEVVVPSRTNAEFNKLMSSLT